MLYTVYLIVFMGIHIVEKKVNLHLSGRSRLKSSIILQKSQGHRRKDKSQPLKERKRLEGLSVRHERQIAKRELKYHINNDSVVKDS